LKIPIIYLSISGGKTISKFRIAGYKKKKVKKAHPVGKGFHRHDCPTCGERMEKISLEEAAIHLGVKDIHLKTEYQLKCEVFDLAEALEEQRLLSVL